MSSFTPTPWLRDGLTIYALNEGGTNRMSISIHGGWQHGCYHATNDTRTSSEELSNNAAFIVKAVNSHTALVAACRAIDADWTATFPEGPEGSREWANGLGTLSDDTVEIWRKIRAALSTEGEKDAPDDDGIKHARTSPGPVNCSTRLRLQNKAYPRTCARCGLGPCPFFHDDGMPKDDGWIEWKGGECPVGFDVLVDFRRACDTESPMRPVSVEAGDLRWVHKGHPTDIIAYRVVRP